MGCSAASWSGTMTVTHSGPGQMSLSSGHDKTSSGRQGNQMRHVTMHKLVSNLTFDHLATFRAIVDTGSFTAAAERLLMTQPAVSQRIRHMESLLGAPLFDRQPGRASRLTVLGERMLRFADQALDVLGRFHQDLGSLRLPTVGDAVTIAAGPSYMKYRLLPIVQAFGREYPDVELRLRHSTSTEELLDAVVDGSADFGIYSAAPPTNRVRSSALTREQVVLVAPPKHPILDLAPENRLAALATMPLAVSSAVANSRQLLDAWAQKHHLTLQVKIEVDNVDTLKQTALQGMTLAFLPSFAVEDELTRKQLVAVRAPGLPLERRVWIVFGAEAPPSAAAKFFAEYLTAYIKKFYEPAG